MGGAQLSNHLPEGIEVVFSDKVKNTVSFGTIMSYKSFKDAYCIVGIANASNTGVVQILDSQPFWRSIETVIILKLNPTPQEKMLYILKGAK